MAIPLRNVPSGNEPSVTFFISLTVGASRLIEAKMDLPRLLFGAGFQIFIVTPQMFRFSYEYVENMRG